MNVTILISQSILVVLCNFRVKLRRIYENDQQDATV